MQVTQKLASSYFHSLSRSSMTARCSAIPFSLGTNPGSYLMHAA